MTWHDDQKNLRKVADRAAKTDFFFGDLPVFYSAAQAGCVMSWQAQRQSEKIDPILAHLWPTLMRRPFELSILEPDIILAAGGRMPDWHEKELLFALLNSTRAAIAKRCGGPATYYTGRNDPAIPKHLARPWSWNTAGDKWLEHLIDIAGGRGALTPQLQDIEAIYQ